MGTAQSRVHLHLLDPIPAAVVAGVSDGLRERGLATEIHGERGGGDADTVPAQHVLDTLPPQHSAPHVFLTSRPLSAVGTGNRTVFHHADIDRDAAIVSLPNEPGESRFAPRVASRVLKLVMHELGHLSGRSRCDEPHCVMSAADSPAALDVQTSSPCSRCTEPTT
jgi:predicted Zn-dependent protease